MRHIRERIQYRYLITYRNLTYLLSRACSSNDVRCSRQFALPFPRSPADTNSTLHITRATLDVTVRQITRHICHSDKLSLRYRDVVRRCHISARTVANAPWQNDNIRLPAKRGCQLKTVSAATEIAPDLSTPLSQYKITGDFSNSYTLPSCRTR